jgi:endonuclease YncB( thermonuclease family)
VRHIRKSLFLILLLAITASNAFAFRATLQGKIMQVKDGDTAVVSPVDGGDFFVCRLYGIDSPEKPKRGNPGQYYGAEATRELKNLILGQTVEIATTGDITYDRQVCLIKANGTDINLEMVKRGAAWAYKHYLKRPYASEYIDAEREARASRFGLWKDRNPIPPWEFRKIARGG